MNSDSGSSRRTFLKNASALSVVATSVASSPILAGSTAEKPKAKKLKLKVKPETSSPGPVVVETGKDVHVAFYGCQENSRGNDMGDGTALVTFRNCHHWRLRVPNDEDSPSHSINIDELDYCEIYEIANSDWNPGYSGVSQMPAGSSSSKNRVNERQNMNHYVITFFGFDPGVIDGATNIECLATGVEANCFANADFDVLLKVMVANELHPSRKQMNTKTSSKIY